MRLNIYIMTSCSINILKFCIYYIMHDIKPLSADHEHFYSVQYFVLKVLLCYIMEAKSYIFHCTFYFIRIKAADREQ